MTYFSKLIYTVVKFNLYNKVSFILQPTKVPNKIYFILPPPHHISFKINVTHTNNLPPRGPTATPGGGHSLGTSGIVNYYRLNDRSMNPAEAKYFFSSFCVQTCYVVHPPSYPMGIGGTFPRGKARPRHDIDHSPHVVPRSIMSRSYTSSPLDTCIT
jgi:hypothetical protein